MNDEQQYLDATIEVESGQVDEALWAKALALSTGDETQAKYRYIELRVPQLVVNPDLHTEQMSKRVLEKAIFSEKLENPDQKHLEFPKALMINIRRFNNATLVILRRSIALFDDRNDSKKTIFLYGTIGLGLISAFLFFYYELVYLWQAVMFFLMVALYCVLFSLRIWRWLKNEDVSVVQLRYAEIFLLCSVIFVVKYGAEIIHLIIK